MLDKLIKSSVLSVVSPFVLLLAACGGSSEDVTSIGGVAAVGAAIQNGSVQLNCQQGRTFSALTGADGRWSVAVPTASLPCAARITGGNPPDVLYSFVRSGGNVANITPLTDLVLARAVAAANGLSLSQWFAAAGASQLDLNTTAQAIEAAIDDLRAALAAIGLSMPFDPLIGPLTAGSASDPHDQLLEGYAATLEANGQSQETAAPSFAAGGSLPPPVETPTPAPNPTPNPTPTPSPDPTPTPSPDPTPTPSPDPTPTPPPTQTPVILGFLGTLRITSSSGTVMAETTDDTSTVFCEPEFSQGSVFELDITLDAERSRFTMSLGGDGTISGTYNSQTGQLSHSESRLERINESFESEFKEQLSATLSADGTQIVGMLSNQNSTIFTKNGETVTATCTSSGTITATKR